MIERLKKAIDKITHLVTNDFIDGYDKEDAIQLIQSVIRDLEEVK